MYNLLIGRCQGLVCSANQDLRPGGTKKARRCETAGLFCNAFACGLVVLDIQNFVKDRAEDAGLAVVVGAVLEPIAAVVHVLAV